jgi:hypothetical protein
MYITIVHVRVVFTKMCFRLKTYVSINIRIAVFGVGQMHSGFYCCETLRKQKHRYR